MITIFVSPLSLSEISHSSEEEEEEEEEEPDLHERKERDNS